MAEADRPSLVVLRSHIGWPSPKYTDTATRTATRSARTRSRAVKEILGLPPDETSSSPTTCSRYYREAGPRGAGHRATQWASGCAGYPTAELATAYEACLAGAPALPGWEAKLPSWQPGEAVATRAVRRVLDAIVDVVPGLVGGGADLTGNTGTALKDARRGRHATTSRAARSTGASASTAWAR